MSNVVAFPVRPKKQAEREPLGDQTIDEVSRLLHDQLHNEIIDVLMGLGQGEQDGERFKLSFSAIASVCQGLVRRINEEVMEGADDLDTLKMIRDDLIQDVNDCFAHFANKMGH